MRSGAEEGFSLVELIVTMAISLIVFGATLAVLEVFQTNNRYDQQRNENQDNARTSMDGISRALRNLVAPNALFNGALEQASAYSLTFQTVDTSKSEYKANASHAMRVHYCLNDSAPNNEILYEQMQRWETAEGPGLAVAEECPDKTAGRWGTTRRLVEHIVNRSGGQSTNPLFRYGPAGAASLSEYLSVETNLLVELNPGTRPGLTKLTSAVSMRNANRQPLAAFTATTIGQKEVLLNASGSVDPDGLALTYKWWQNGAVVSTTSQQWQTAKLATGEYTFKLEVTNPGELHATTEKKVKVE